MRCFLYLSWCERERAGGRGGGGSSVCVGWGGGARGGVKGKEIVGTLGPRPKSMGLLLVVFVMISRPG